MDIIYKLDISLDDIKIMIEQCPAILDMTEEEIKVKIEILKNIKCDDNQIKNILICNPYYLDLLGIDVIKLINKLIDFGITSINYLIENNPFILNKDVFEINEYIKEKTNLGKPVSQIIDDIEKNPLLLTDI